MPHIQIEPTGDGLNIQLNVTEPPQRAITAAIDAKDTGHFVTGLLGACVDCAKKTGEFSKLKRKETDQKHLQYVTAHKIAIADAVDVADAAVVVFAIGATELSIGLPKDVLATLGQAILTLSSDSSRAH